jgi:hypothetical protein
MPSWRMPAPGTYLEADHSPVPYRSAVDAWSQAALPVLLDTARVYNAVITYKELGEAVQAQTGIRTRVLLMNWIGQVLEHVAAECHRQGELQLTALCVHQDGTVGAGYAGAVGRYGGRVPEDPEERAAEVRLACYRKYAHDLPADGGQAQLTRQEAARRRAAAPPPPVQLCPVHHTALPRTGRCDDCS